MRIHEVTLKSGIVRTPEFEKKGLATHAVNVGVKCGNGCWYCSTGAVLRLLEIFKTCGENPFGFGYAMVDPHTPDRVARDAQRIKQRGKIQLCTLTDAWAPEARTYNLGRRSLEAILSEPDWTVRILTKNAAIEYDFDFIAQYRDRVQIGLSITAGPDKTEVMKAVEPNASSNTERMAVLRKAHDLGLRTYLMACPILPGMMDTPDALTKLIQFAGEIGAEEIFAEPINSRGGGLKLTQEALETAGYPIEAQAIQKVRSQANWSGYVAGLLKCLQDSTRKHDVISQLRFLLYPSRLTPHALAQIRQDDAGVVWLG
jgi:DNA repair photolyase